MQETSPPGRQGKKGDSSASSKKSASRAGGKRRGRLTPEAITETAIRIADADGLDAVSIRRVAAELDARPMSLYNHFSSKSDLLSSMADEVTGEVLVKEPLPDDWREALTAIARHMYAMMVAHPWLIYATAERPRFGPNASKVAKQAAQAVESLPLEPGDVWAIQGTVNDYVLGHSLRIAAAPKASDLEDVIPESDMADSPELASLPDALRSRSSVERFELGLQTVLDGVEARFLKGA